MSEIRGVRYVPRYPAGAERRAVDELQLFACFCTGLRKDELAQVIRQLDQVQASLERARALSAQSADDGRFYFDYVRASQDIVSMKQGISHYLDPSRAQPRDAAAVEGRYRQERAQ